AGAVAGAAASAASGAAGTPEAGGVAGSASPGTGDAAAGAAALGALAGVPAGTPGAAGEPVDFRALKALLPERLGGLSRSQATGQKSSALGIRASSAEAEYGSEDQEANVHLTITDMGTMTSWAMLGHAWLNTEVDSETETGYERALKLGGYPAYEEFDQSEGYRSGELTVVVAQRFVVELKGNQVDMDVLRAGAEQIDFGQLEKLKGESTAAQTALADFRALKALLPERAAGLPRTNHTGQQTSAQGFQTSTAEADYAQDQCSVHVTITDMGSLSGLAALGYAWTATQIDSESDRGFERTVRYGEHPGYQKFEKTGDSTRAELQVVVKRRFVVALNGSGVEMADLEATLGGIDLAKLAGM
ncbi:MAG: hypothetical protein AB1505_20820, partial [Candidatus Latescibacterota bacterium]